MIEWIKARSARRAVLLVCWLTLLLVLAACRTQIPPGEVTPVSGATQLPSPSGIPSPTPFTPLDPTPLDTAEPAQTSTDQAPLLPEVTPFVVGVIGDFGEDGQPLADVAALIKSWQPAFIVTVGDNNYPSGAAETIDNNIGKYFAEYIHPYQGAYGPGAEENRFWPALGNHDLDTANGQAYYDYFSLPGNERYYDVRQGPLHLFILNSDSREPDGVGRSSVQAQWLQAGLASSDAVWKLVIMHVPPFSSGERGGIDWMEWPFAEWGADAVLAGHEHHYERLAIDGIPYFINGLGGGARYALAAEPHPASQIAFRDDWGAQRLIVNDVALIFEFITRAGVVIDSFTLEKAAASPGLASLPSVTSFPDPTSYSWTVVAEINRRPIGLVPAPDGRLFIVRQPGFISIYQDGQILETPFMDLTDRVGINASEQGLLGMALHPDFASNGQFFLNYTDFSGDTVISRFTVSAGDPNRGDPSSEQVLLRLDQPYPNHNGGHLLFGPDGLLYIGTGDGGSAGDPDDNAQDPFHLLGKMLRIDVDSQTGGLPYGIPEGNSYTDGSGGREIWAIGLRNPWRYAFDALTGDLYIADVGQNQYEEVSFLPAGSPAGVNFGWDYREAVFNFEGQLPAGTTLLDPVTYYSHAEGCSISGGEVYRGSRWVEWQGVYFYGDYCTGFIWGLLRLPDGTWLNQRLFQLQGQITDFAVDARGDLYLADPGGRIWRLEN